MEKKRAGRAGIRVFAAATILAAMLLVAAAPGAMAAGEEDAQGSSIKPASPSRIHAGRQLRLDARPP